jgi:hypothetical protein
VRHPGKPPTGEAGSLPRPEELIALNGQRAACYIEL